MLFTVVFLPNYLETKNYFILLITVFYNELILVLKSYMCIRIHMYVHVFNTMCVFNTLEVCKIRVFILILEFLFYIDIIH